MNSVGDTYADWNSEAAFALEERLYMISGIAVLVVVTTLIMALIKPTVRKKSPPGLLQSSQDMS